MSLFFCFETYFIFIRVKQTCLAVVKVVKDWAKVVLNDIVRCCVTTFKALRSQRFVVSLVEVRFYSILLSFVYKLIPIFLFQVVSNVFQTWFTKRLAVFWRCSSRTSFVTPSHTPNTLVARLSRQWTSSMRWSDKVVLCTALVVKYIISLLFFKKRKLLFFQNHSKQKTNKKPGCFYSHQIILLFSSLFWFCNFNKKHIHLLIHNLIFIDLFIFNIKKKQKKSLHHYAKNKYNCVQLSFF